MSHIRYKTTFSPFSYIDSLLSAFFTITSLASFLWLPPPPPVFSHYVHN